VLLSSSQSASSYIIRNPQPRRSSQSQTARGRDEEQDDIVSADVEEVRCPTLACSTTMPNIGHFITPVNMLVGWFAL